MDKSAGHNRASALYPPIEPFDRQMLDVGDGHRIYVEQCGARDGIPVVVFHGGPGGGCSPIMRRYFDPGVYRVILFDQRGCGRSRPHASVENNTTWDLVRDIERIRKSFGIDKWVVFGGSWGATLSLIYAISHPDRCLHLVLRGVFLMTQSELRWFYGGGAGAFWPETWNRFAKLVPASEQDDFIAAYHQRLFSDDLSVQTRYARAWTHWENSLASVKSRGFAGEAPADYARAFARIENHYFSNLGWLGEDDWILKNIDHIQDIPGNIVHGSQDMICPPSSAWRLSAAWASSQLRIIKGAGHALSEPGITRELLRIMDGLYA